MLRRRIFSAAMASVMALSSVAVVAQAAETTNQVKTKEDLKTLITETYGESWRVSELGDTEEYTASSVEAMIKALDAADNILADSESTEADYTVAYLMVEAAAAKLSVNSWKTVEELDALIKECQALINEYPNDILNEELQDQFYYYDGYAALVNEIDSATYVLGSTYPPTITEAYNALMTAKNNLKKKPAVTKSEFRAIMKKYQDAYASQYDWDLWRRGTEAAWSGANAVWAWVYGNIADDATKTQIEDAYSALDAVKSLVKTTDENIVAGYNLAKDMVALYEGFKGDNVAKSTKAGLAKLISDYHGLLAYDYCTTDVVDLVTSINQALVAVDASAKISTVDIRNNETLIDFAGGITAADVWETHYVGSKLGYAKAQIKIASSVKTVYVPVNDAGVWERGKQIATSLAGRDAEQTYQTITIGSYFDLANLVGSIDDLVAEAYEAWFGAYTDEELNNLEGYYWHNGASAYLPYALDIAQDYISSSKADITNPESFHPIAQVDINTIDDTGIIAKDEPKGYASEYILAYRYLYYALTDTYGNYSNSTSEDKHTRAEVVDLIAKSWDLIEETGDAAIFRASNVDLVKARKEAMLWVSESRTDKAYIEYMNNDEMVNTEYYKDLTSTDVFHALNAAYKQLKTEYDALAISFDDIYEKIADTAAAIDAGELEATDVLLKALDEVAYALSEVDYVTHVSANEQDLETTTEYLDNPAFDSERVYNKNNRLITKLWDPNNRVYGAYIQEIGAYLSHGENSTHAALYKAYNALNDAIKAQAEPDVVLGDVDGDGKVLAADASMILKSLVGLAEVDKTVADFNKDGTVNAADAADILKSLVD